MANSRFEYVKEFEARDEVMAPNIIIVRIHGRDFARFCEVHELVKPNDEVAQSLMNSCAASMVEEYPVIVFSYGYGDEYSFVLKKTTKFYMRRASKIQSVFASFFTSVYVTKWKEFFPHKEMKHLPSFRARLISCATTEVLQAYLLWRQNDCHVKNLHAVCLHELVKHGQTEREAGEFLKGTQKKDKNDLLFEKFGINYEKTPAMFRQGSCILKTEVEHIVKYSENGAPVKRIRRKASIVHSMNIAGASFWNQHHNLLKELGSFTDGFGIVEPDYIRSFEHETKLLPSTWITIRIDGCHFHRFSDIHEFVKPNDERALNLMNSCASAVLKEFEDVVFSYGVSDEYSFILNKDSQLYQRRPSDIVTAIVSVFTGVYVAKWKEFFPQKELKYPPSFDGRAVCYPSSEIVCDYLSWRQVDCHINNQYNTCFWELVEHGKSKSEAQKHLKGTQTADKNEVLKQFGISEYNMLPAIFRLGSSVFWEKNNVILEDEKGEPIVKHCNIIDPSFWKSHPWILSDKPEIVLDHCKSFELDCSC